MTISRWKIMACMLAFSLGGLAFIAGPMNNRSNAQFDDASPRTEKPRPEATQIAPPTPIVEKPQAHEWLPETLAPTVTVKVQEKPTGSFMVGAGVTSDAGLTGGIMVNERNFDAPPPPIANPASETVAIQFVVPREVSNDPEMLPAPRVAGAATNFAADANSAPATPTASLVVVPLEVRPIAVNPPVEEPAQAPIPVAQTVPVVVVPASGPVAVLHEPIAPVQQVQAPAPLLLAPATGAQSITMPQPVQAPAPLPSVVAEPSGVNKPATCENRPSVNEKVYYVIVDQGGQGERVYRLPICGSDTIRDALGHVSELNLDSKEKRIWIDRPSREPNKYLPIDWKAITADSRSETNYQVLPGDRIFVNLNGSGSANPYAPYTASATQTCSGVATAAVATDGSKLKMLLRLGDGKPRFEIRNTDSAELLFKVFGQKVELQSAPEGMQSSPIAGVTAVGQVRFVGPGIEGTCDQLSVLSGTGEVLLKGNVHMKTKHGKAWNELTGEKMIYQIGANGLSTASSGGSVRPASYNTK